ncbi:MAG: beta-galactosidase [Verrucomicrobiota bacterium JB024]|nr:beta-galactosidase [Verrucomicrobiota bacterium JB024]
MAALPPTPARFPLGFVHGDPALTQAMGYDFRQLPTAPAGFADGEPYPQPPAYLAHNGLTYHSLAIAGESLLQELNQAAQEHRTHLDTRAFGKLRLALNPEGKPWKRPLDRLDLFDPATVRFLHEATRAHVQTQATSCLDPHIRFWGLDNEWEGRANYSAEAREAFVKWLRQAYRDDLERLNRCWDTRYDSFDQIREEPLPTDAEALSRPGRFLDGWQFQSEQFTAFLAGLVRTAREADPHGRGVIHKATQLTLEQPSWRERLLDQAAFAELIREDSGGYFGQDMYGHGDRQAYELNYVYHCIAPATGEPGYGVMLCENNNHNGPAGQFAATQWRLLANGLKGMVYFTTGFAGGEGDWDVFSFVDPRTGALKEKFYHAPRWANHVRRSDAFWRTCQPASGLPRLALLMPRRDILVSDISGRNPASPRYSYPLNHRWMLYRWLREQGYWVDVIPYTRLTPDFLAGYDALCLIGAAHLTADECAAVRTYVCEQGGILLADEQTGLYDEHHDPRHQLDELIGVKIAESWQEQPGVFTLGGNPVTAHHCLPAQSLTARPLSIPTLGADLPAYLNRAGKGTVLYLPFALGSLESECGAGCLASAKSDAATAESEEYAAWEGEFEAGRWLAKVLQEAGVNPAYRCASEQELFRIEQPQVDAAGNCAVVVTTRAQTQPEETLPAGPVELPLPPGPWKSVWWAAAEETDFSPVEILPVPGTPLSRIKLPAVKTAGTLYLFKAQHPPLIGINVATPETPRSVDGLTARVRPGQAFSVNASLLAVTEDLPSGSLQLTTPDGWTVEATALPTNALACGERLTCTFTITVPDDPCPVRPDRLWPLRFNWTDGHGHSEEALVCVELALDADTIPHLLSANASFPASYPYRIPTGATYRYLEPADPMQIADPASAGPGHSGHALTNGFGSIGGQRHSHHRDQLRLEHVARYGSERVEVCFDLQAEYRLRRVVLVAGVAAVWPTSVRVRTSTDGETFTEQTALTLDTPQLEIQTPAFDAHGRYVRVEVCWPDSGGCLDEIEIWGHRA